MRELQNYPAIFWLFIFLELLLAAYLVVRLVLKNDEPKNWLALTLLALLIGYDFIFSGQSDFSVFVTINILGIMLTVIMMLVSFFRPRQKVEQTPTIRELNPNPSAFELKCAEYNISDKETEVVLLLAQGLTYEEIAEKLFISKRTVESRAQNVYRKVGTSNRIVLFKMLEL